MDPANNGMLNCSYKLLRYGICCLRNTSEEDKQAPDEVIAQLEGVMSTPTVMRSSEDMSIVNCELSPPNRTEDASVLLRTERNELVHQLRITNDRYNAIIKVTLALEEENSRLRGYILKKNKRLMHRISSYLAKSTLNGNR